MGLTSSQGLAFQLVANGQTLDLFKDEEIKISDNVTGLFDIGELPSEFSRTITLPGTKKNNAFFEHVYDISVINPFLFSTNKKVDAYFDFGGIYISSGYLQLNKVSVIANKYVDSYEVTVYGSLSSFAREINRSTLNDLTTLEQYNHTASFTNISSSWDGDLFNGDIVYPLIDYGSNIEYDYDRYPTGINSPSGALGTQNFKPAIRVQRVFDAIFEQYGYTYSSPFIDSGILDDVYMVCDRDLNYPVFDGVNLEGYGVFEAAPISGSDTDVAMANNTYLALTYDSIITNPQFSYTNGLYTVDRMQTLLKGRIKLVVNVNGSSGVPQFTLQAFRTEGGGGYQRALERTNIFFREIESQNSSTGDRTYTLEEEFTMNVINGTYRFELKYDNYNGSSFSVTNNPDGDVNGYIAIDEVTNAGDYRVMNIARNLPQGGESGIRQIDFIKGLQKKYNLIIYPSKTIPNNFIVDTFNSWYKRGSVKNFDRFIDLNKKIEVTPANNLAVRELNFGDKRGKDFLALQFEKAVNRDFGTVNYVDNKNFFSQGKLDVETTFSVSPLRYIQGTGVVGSSAPTEGVSLQVGLGNYEQNACAASLVTIYNATGNLDVGQTLYIDFYLTQPLTGYSYVSDQGDVFRMDSATGLVVSFEAPCIAYPSS
tara:strand:+ start:86 stop:2041 length:1956 start_codon:yes stop_codon:yes gene_type:complete